MSYVDENVKNDAEQIHKAFTEHEKNLHIPEPEFVINRLATDVLTTVSEEIIMGYHPALGVRNDPADTDVVDPTDIVNTIIRNCAKVLSDMFIRREISSHMYVYISMYLSHLIVPEMPGSLYYGLDDTEVMKKMIPENHLDVIRNELRLKALKDKNI